MPVRAGERGGVLDFVDDDGAMKAGHNAAVGVSALCVPVLRTWDVPISTKLCRGMVLVKNEERRFQKEDY